MVIIDEKKAIDLARKYLELEKIEIDACESAILFNKTLREELQTTSTDARDHWVITFRLDKPKLFLRAIQVKVDLPLGKCSLISHM